MRLTGGRDRGRRLTPVRGLKIRPTSDKVRSAVFNLIGQDASGQNVLDLFAGAGGFGLEALSRGADWALFIDHSRRALDIIGKNLDLCGYGSRGGMIRKDLTKGLPLHHPLLSKRFDLVFMDPPYGRDLIGPTLKEIRGKDLLAPGAKVIAEGYKEDFLPERQGRLVRTVMRLYGETKIGIYQYGDET